MKYTTIPCLSVLFAAMFMVACKGNKTNSAEPPKPAATTVYKGSNENANDLVHTSLFLEPVFSSRTMHGRAEITLRPHFYPVDSLILDAKYMRIIAVQVKPTEAPSAEHPLDADLKYTYDSLKLRIKLNRRYSRDETYTIMIKYVAMPENVKSEGSKAISGRKGLYFINHNGTDAGKPTQLWTQGETEASSCWFPTIDAPNQKTTQEVRITVPARYKSVSNGAFMGSELRNDSLRTDYWKQDKPHAPYLFALAVGNFAEVKDTWRSKPVHYFVEPEYERYARMVFGNTPEMLEFYSNTLGYAYPWEKYHQVVVRDFVSGAMENTGCVIHYDRLQHDHRDHLDNPHEDIIAHELFHHWFGDLLTCESWSNIPLNESFATYGEYLWNAYKYGRDEADHRLNEFHGSYLSEARTKQEPLIRYHYVDQEDMFDAHSYQKGGSVLHMLRHEVGDEAFFAALKLYLYNNAFGAVEVSDLRKAFESVTGKDLNWFFNQWFLSSGHPVMEVSHKYTTGSGYILKIKQTGKVFRLSADIAFNGHIQRVKLDSAVQLIHLPMAGATDYVQFDAGAQLLGEIKEIKSAGQWKQQMEQAVLAAHRLMAYEQLWELDKDPANRLSYSIHMLKDAFHGCRTAAYQKLNKTNFSEQQLRQAAEIFKDAHQSEPKAYVRRASVTLFKDAGRSDVLKAMLGDSSYQVLRASLTALGQTDGNAAMQFADAQRDASNRRVRQIVLNTIARYSNKDETEYLRTNMLASSKPADIENYANALATFMLYKKPEGFGELLKSLDLALSNPSDSTRSRKLKAVRVMKNYYNYQSYYLEIMLQYDSSDKTEQKKRIRLCKEMAASMTALHERHKSS